MTKLEQEIERIIQEVLNKLYETEGKRFNAPWTKPLIQAILAYLRTHLEEVVEVDEEKAHKILCDHTWDCEITEDLIAALATGKILKLREER